MVWLSFTSRCNSVTLSYTLYTSYYRYDLTVDEAIELGKRAIMHATHRDAYSGGTNNGKYRGIDVLLV